MHKGIRWRIISLQVVLVLVLGFVAGFAYWAASFTHDQVTTQLAAQQITFPTASNAGLKALPAADRTAMLQYAGQTMTNGAQAEVYADHYLKVHLSEMPTYSQASAAARAHPDDPKAAATLNTVFTGTMLRSTLLNAYGWWTVGTYAFYAAIVLTGATLAVLIALAFELWRWAVTAREEKLAFAEAPAPAFDSQRSPGYGVTQFSRHDS